jgi:hypothetical protein
MKFKFRGSDLLYTVNTPAAPVENWTDITDLDVWWNWSTNGDGGINKVMTQNPYSLLVDYYWIASNYDINIRAYTLNMTFDKIRFYLFIPNSQFGYYVNGDSENGVSGANIDMSVSPYVISNIINGSTDAIVEPYGNDVILTADTVFGDTRLFNIGVGIPASEIEMLVYKIEVLNLVQHPLG